MLKNWSRPGLPGCFALALVALLAGRSLAAEVAQGKFLYCKQLALLAQRPQLKPPERRDLANYHYRLGLFYEIVARCTSRIMQEAADCYAADKTFVWGAEYFGAIGALAQGDTARARKYLSDGARCTGAPSVILDLERDLKRLLDQPDGTVLSSLLDRNSKSVWDSLEVLARSPKEAVSTVAASVLASRSLKSLDQTVDFSPLVQLVRLRVLAESDDPKALRQELLRIESEGLPVWHISGARGTARFGDPRLISYMARLHLELAAGEYLQVLSEDASALTSPKFALEACLRQGDVSSARKFMKSGSGPEGAVYSGWAAWLEGKTGEAQRYWSEVLQGSDTLSQCELLRVWAGFPQLRDHADSLRSTMLASLGSLREQSRRNNSKDRDKRVLIYRRAAESYVASAKFDSALICFGRFFYSNVSVDLSNYQPETCASYYEVLTLHGAPDFRQQGYEGWEGLRKYFPTVASVLEPLQIAIACSTMKILDVSGEQVDD